MEVTTIPASPLRGGSGVLYLDQALSSQVCAACNPALQQKYTSAQNTLLVSATVSSLQIF